MSFVPTTHFYRQKTKYTKPAPNPVPTTIICVLPNNKNKNNYYYQGQVNEKGVVCKKVCQWGHIFVTPGAGSIFRSLSQTHISKSEFKNGHISIFCSVFQIIQVISSEEFFSAEEVDLSFNS